MKIKVNKKFAKKENGTIFVDFYPLKNDTVFELDQRWELGIPKTPEKTIKAGALVSITVSKTLSGNYADLRIRDSGGLWVHTFQKNGPEVKLLIETIYDKQ